MTRQMPSLICLHPMLVLKIRSYGPEILEESTPLKMLMPCLWFTTPIPPPPNILWKEFWKLPGPPKIYLFGWKYLHNVLPLGGHLIKKNFHIHASCAFGCDVEEDVNHLFLAYPLSRAAWFGSPMVIISDNLLQLGFKNWTASLFSGVCHNTFNPELFLDILTFVWLIYNHRNKVRFQGTPPNHSDIIQNWHTLKASSNPALSPFPLQRPTCGSTQRRFHTVNRSPSSNFFYVWHKTKQQNKNIMGMFHFDRNLTILDFYSCEPSSKPIHSTTLAGI